MKNNFTKISLILLFITIAICVFSTKNIFAQNTISGVVFDQNQKPVADIDVELLDELERYLTSTKTKGSGLYIFAGLRAGTYYIRPRVFGTGFKDNKERIQLGQGNRTNRTTGAISGSESVQVNINLEIDPRRVDNSTLNNSVVFAQNVPESARQSYENAVKKIENKKQDDGIADLLSAISEFPEYFLALDRLGNEYLAQNKFIEAENVFKKAVEINPKSFSSFFGISVAQNNLGKKNETLGNLQKAVELNQTSVSALLLLGIVQREVKQFDDSENSLKKAKKFSNSKEPDVHWNLALLYYYNLKRFVDAAEELELYLKTLPKEDSPEMEQKKAQTKKFIKILREKAKESSE
jgi:tetratricopeptide (TPR) repeat protein